MNPVLHISSDMNRSEVVHILESNDLHAKTKFGQNFLCNEDIIKRIIEVSGVGPDSVCLEIGPGIGALTEPLSDLCSSLTAVEIDKELFSYLEKTLGSKVTLHLSDYLKLKKEDYIVKPYDHVLSNIPYYVMTGIMKKLMVDCGNAEKMTFMVEDEAIARIICEPSTKQYGPLAVLVGVYGSARREFTVPSDCFYPMPHTVSAVITLSREDRGFEITVDFCSFVEAAFSKRRKTLSNSLSAYLSSVDVKMPFKEALKTMDLEEIIRAEVLKPLDFVELYKLLLL